MRPEQIFSEIKFLLFALIRSVPKNIGLVDGDVSVRVTVFLHVTARSLF